MSSPPSSTGGGFVFVVDPDLRAPDTHIFWSPALDPSVVIVGLGVTPSDTSPVFRAAVERAEIVSETDSRYRLLRIGAALFPLFISQDLTPDDTLSAIALFDALLPDRLDTISRFWRALQHSPSPPPSLTAQRRSRLLQILRAFDARRGGLSYRSIAETLFPKHRIDATSWAGNALRETTIRLVRDGIKLVNGGYRSLLGRHRKH